MLDSAEESVGAPGHDDGDENDDDDDEKEPGRLDLRTCFGSASSSCC